MATITNLVAINDIAHGKQVFRVHGTVTVASPAVEPVLVEPSCATGVAGKCLSFNFWIAAQSLRRC